MHDPVRAPFAGAGTAITRIGLEVIEVDDASVHVPYWELEISAEMD